MKLRQYTLEYHPWMTIKGQALADFIIECSFSKPDSSDQPGEVVSSVTNAQTARTSWTLYVDESTTSDFNGAGVILTSPEEFRVQQAIHFQFKATNNEAEYEAIFVKLRLARSLEV